MIFEAETKRGRRNGTGIVSRGVYSHIYVYMQITNNNEVFVCDLLFANIVVIDTFAKWKR